MTSSQFAKNDKLLRVCITVLNADAQGGAPIDESTIVATVRMYAPVAGRHLTEAEIQDVVEELTRRFNVWTGKAGTLIGIDPGHQAWLQGKRGEIQWRFWDRYRMLLQNRLAPRVLSELDEITDHILGLLEDPARPGVWRRQGLVVGHVQSGKTGNYTGLLCKAADAGYKVIVILSGIHNSLRAQTQIRLDEGFLGYAKSFSGGSDARVLMGVGSIDPTVVADSVTTRDENGDFSSLKAKGFQIHAGGNVLLFVVKKNAKVLRNLLQWAQLSAKKPIKDDRRVVGEVPLLVIDDEADQASVDTKFQVFDEDGQPDADHQPSAINHLIRELLETFEKRAYVGYTATPFANVFIHPEGRTPKGGEDLFPKHFIVNLSAPSDYFGPSRIFGRLDEGLPAQGVAPSRIRFVADATGWIPPSHKSGLVPRYEGRDEMPPSLKEAICSFVLSSAARRVRGQLTEHKSMLIHVTRFTAVQQHVHRLVSLFVNELAARWRARQTSGGDSLLDEMHALWDRDFATTSTAHAEIAPQWAAVEPEVWPILELLKVNLINAKASDALIYEEHKSAGLHVIAVGGDKLSRGLTLEGLSVSYFLRSARMYDTLMQMGRWFGYRPGYEDLCRLYLSEELAEWYGHITEAAEELRGEFDRMVLLGGTPDDYGLRVRTHPVLAITGKLRPGLPEMTTSLSATPFEPTVLVEDSDKMRRNWEQTREFVTTLRQPAEFPVVTDDKDAKSKRGTWPGAMMWRDVRGHDVLQLLRRFHFADRELTRTPSTAVTAYISDRLLAGELTTWTVVVLGKDSPSSGQTPEMPDSLQVELGGRAIWTIYRKRLASVRPRPGLYVVKRLGSPRDESIDLSSEAWYAVEAQLKQLAADPQRDGGLTRGRLVRDQRPRSSGLLILYLLTPDRTKWDENEGDQVPLVAPFVSFPNSSSAKPVSYKLSYRYWEDELQGVE